MDTTPKNQEVERGNRLREYVGIQRKRGSLTYATLMLPFYPPKEALDLCGLNEKSTIAEGVYRLVWGTYGKPAQADCRWVRMCELTTEHLENIIATQRQIPEFHSRVILAILRERYKEEK